MLFRTRSATRAAAALFAPLLFAAGCAAPPIPPGVRIAAGEEAARGRRLEIVAAEVTNVPPVVQKSPGYCAPATLERALACAGVSVPQGQLALLGGCTKDGGSDVEAFFEGVGRALAGRGVRIRALLPVSAERAAETARRYNRLAGPAGVFPLLVPERSTRALDLAKVFSKADPAVLREATADGVEPFLGLVRREVEAGRPLLWGVVLGIVPEGAVPPGTRSGHLRLVVGYDLRAGTILYSDPWAPDCAAKSMQAADAWAITQSLHVVVPL